MKKIVIGTNFSDEAKNAADHAVSTFGVSGITYYLVNGYGPWSSDKEVSEEQLAALCDDSENLLDEEHERLAQEFGRTLQVEKLARAVGPVKAIARTIDEVKPDLLVLGTPKGKYVVGFWRTSMASAFIGDILCPILAVPQGRYFEKIEKICYATDYEDIGPEWMQPLNDLLDITDAELTLFHVDQGYLEESRLMNREEVAEIFDGHRIEFVEVNEGSVVRRITSYVQESGCDLIVILARRESVWQDIFATSTADKLSMHLKVPLLVLHENFI